MTSTITSTEVTPNDTTNETNDDETLVVYLTPSKVHSWMGIEVIKKMAELWPNGMQPTERRIRKLRSAVMADRPRYWHVDVAHGANTLLTSAGRIEFDRLISQLSAVTNVDRYVAKHRAAAWAAGQYIAFAREHNVSPDDVALRDELYVKYAAISTEQSRREQQAFDAIEIKKFKILCDLAARYPRAIAAQPPRRTRTADGQMIIRGITLQVLGSCEDYVNSFNNAFPDGTHITEEICVEHCEIFDWHWAVQRMLVNGDRLVERFDALRRTISDELRNSTDLARENTRHEERVRELDTAQQAELVNFAVYRQKSRDEAARHRAAMNSLSTSTSALMARAFARLYVEHARPELGAFGA